MGQMITAAGNVTVVRQTVKRETLQIRANLLHNCKDSTATSKENRGASVELLVRRRVDCITLGCRPFRMLIITRLCRHA